jgi:hypothetical protein
MPWFDGPTTLADPIGPGELETSETSHHDGPSLR